MEYGGAVPTPSPLATLHVLALADSKRAALAELVVAWADSQRTDSTEQKPALVGVCWSWNAIVPELKNQHCVFVT